MADETPQRRVLPARHRRESVAKRRASSPIPANSPPAKKALTTPAQSLESRTKRKYVKRASLVHAPTSRPDTPNPTSIEEALPTKLTASKPLPTSLQKQLQGMGDTEYQSIADSAVLAASLHRSRMQWLCDGVFRKYWTKPVKRKGVEAPPDNPEQKSMVKLGTATITIEPHNFDVVFYTVKDTHAPPPPPYYRHPNQHTAKPPYPSVPAAPPYNPCYPIASAPSHGPAPASVTASPPSNTQKNTGQPATPAIPAISATPAIKQEKQLTAGPSTAKSVSTQAPPVQPQSSVPPVRNSQPPTPPAASKSNTDPVIQMLAARAATDARLKDLMKVVATSTANAEQLKEFQGHIDEFNAIIKKQEADRVAWERNKPKSAKDTQPAASPAQLDGAADTKSSGASVAIHPSGYSLPHQSVRPPPPGPRPTAPPLMAPYLAYPHPPPRPEALVKHIVLEFTGAASSTQSASQDRWLFPEHAVLELIYGKNEMVCSYLIERKGLEILAAQGKPTDEEGGPQQNKWKSEVEYYEPVTMRIVASQHKVIETIARSAKSLPAVQGYMKEVMEKKTRAPHEFLVHRLPREKAGPHVEVGTEFVDSAVELNSGDEDDELKDFYGN